MTNFPLPVRLAAGLIASALEQARDLPRLVVELPVTAVSQALQTSMRMQQKVTDLAIKGDRALGTLRPAQDRPSWATFDDEEPVVRRNGSVVTALRPEPAPPAVPHQRPADPAGPTALPGYDELSIPQLRAKLRVLTVEDLRALLAWEETHQNRPPFATMLGNRIETVTG